AAASGESRGALGDGARAGRAAGALPEVPRIAWRKSLVGPLEVPPVASADGRIAVVLVGAMDVQLFGRGGEDLGAVALGAPVAPTSPVFLADGGLVALTLDGQVVFAGADRRVRHRFTFGARGGDVLSLTPTPSG